jgi:hypothetical protein
MTMSEDHIYFQVNQARFVVSAENFMKVLFLTYDVVRSYEHDRAHVAACEGTPQSMELVGLHTIIWAVTCLRRGADPTTLTSSPS